MSSYQDLLRQKEALDRQIEEARKREIADAVTRVRAVIAEYGLTERDVFSGIRSSRGRKSATAGTKVAPKYRDPATGATWTGRGKAPKWIEGKDRAQFAL
ncbi:MAG: H-NS histone family protein [Burkholderiaceae bacterium]|jgi:DNA-binding protein H-NS|nr:H-NS histone family protein [Burkholderiaceae bacterium]